MEKKTIKKPCEICGKVIEAPKGRQKYCSNDCKRAAAYRQHARYRGKKQPTNKENMNALVEIARKAKEEGLSYGQYCQKHGLY